MIRNEPKTSAIAQRDFSRWFALFSPLIGVLLGCLAVLVLYK